MHGSHSFQSHVYFFLSEGSLYLFPPTLFHHAHYQRLTLSLVFAQLLHCDNANTTYSQTLFIVGPHRNPINLIPVSFYSSISPTWMSYCSIRNGIEFFFSQL